MLSLLAMRGLSVMTYRAVRANFLISLAHLPLRKPGKAEARTKTLPATPCSAAIIRRAFEVAFLSRFAFR